MPKHKNEKFNANREEEIEKFLSSLNKEHKDRYKSLSTLRHSCYKDIDKRDPVCLPEKAYKEFNEIWEKKYGFSLPEELAEEYADNIMRLFRAVYKVNLRVHKEKKAKLIQEKADNEPLQISMFEKVVPNQKAAECYKYLEDNETHNPLLPKKKKRKR
ncbi:MAG: hypothetical protein GY730_01020 [bacterium]|nr:hypothetical protein [bacterium]